MITRRPTDGEYREHVLEHYRGEAAREGLSETSTMADVTTRSLELKAIFAAVAQAGGLADKRVLEIGCGNGILLETLYAHDRPLQLRHPLISEKARYFIASRRGFGTRHALGVPRHRQS